MNRFLVPLGFVAALVIAVTLWMFMPQLIGAQYGDQMQKAGFLVPALIMLLILQISCVVERMLSLRRAQGRGSLPDFLNNVRKALHTGDVDGAIRRMSSMMRAGTRNPAFCIWSPYCAPMSCGMNIHRVTAITRAATKPSGTRKRFMGF